MRTLHPGDLVEIVSLDGNTWTVRRQAWWSLGHRAVVLSVAWDGKWAQLEIHTASPWQARQEVPWQARRELPWRLRTSGLKVLDPTIDLS